MPISPSSIEWGFIDPKGKTVKPDASKSSSKNYGHEELAKDLGIRNEIVAMQKGYVRYAIGKNGAVVFETHGHSPTTGRISKFITANKKITGKVFVDDQSNIRVFQNKAKAVAALRSLGEGYESPVSYHAKDWGFLTSDGLIKKGTKEDGTHSRLAMRLQFKDLTDALKKGKMVRWAVGKAGDAAFEYVSADQANRVLRSFIRSRHDITGKVTLDIIGKSGTRSDLVLDGPDEAMQRLRSVSESTLDTNEEITDKDLGHNESVTLKSGWHQLR